jgi:RHS repeat-associated protein
VDVQYKPTAAAVVGGVYTANLSFDLNALPSLSVGLTGSLFTGLNTYYIHSDHLDSPRSITNTAGQEVWRWDNTDPFGNNIANENPSNLGAFTFNLRFPGQYFDRETGLHYNVNRDYNPAVGRYIQSDPIGLGGGINIFGYVGGNPLGYSDSSGLCPVCPIVWAMVEVMILVDSATSDMPVPGAGVAKAGAKAASCAAEKGGLNLFKFGQETTTKVGGWKQGDFMLYLPDKGGAQANWAQNASRLREQMGRGEPIYDSYRNVATGKQIATGGFLGAERKLLESRGWQYNSATGAYHPPSN